MCDQLRQDLLDAASRFRQWISEHGEDANGDGESAYEGWGAAYAAFTAFVRGCPRALWDDAATQAALYLVARDQESEILVDEVTEDACRLIALAKAAIRYPEPDARWQMADRLGDLRGQEAEVEPLLVQFTRDKDEYVRRRAILALGRLGSPLVEEVAEGAWNTGHEYQRIAVLSALRSIGSPQLQEYLDRAMADGRCYLVAHAATIQAGGAG
jgi:HEAT repeat protein